jgi:hypothetical protein
MAYYDERMANARVVTGDGEQSRAISGWTWMQKLWNRLRPMLIQEVPEELAVCEFHCAHPNCTVGHWDVCELRRAYGEQHEQAARADSAMDAYPDERLRRVVH